MLFAISKCIKLFSVSSEGGSQCLLKFEAYEESGIIKDFFIAEVPNNKNGTFVLYKLRINY